MSPVIGVDGAWVRPGEVLVDTAFEDRIADRLRELGGRPYVPSGDEGDWRQHPLAPEYGDVNARLDEAELGCRLWVGFSTRRAVDLVRKRKLPGVHFNSVFFGESILGYYQGGPKGFAMPIPGPPQPPTPYTGGSTVNVGVFDTGMPDQWKTHYPALANTVDVGSTTPPDLDPVGSNMVVALHGCHGLFICGLIARQHRELGIESRRVIHLTGEVDDVKAGLAIVASNAAVLNLSFGGYLPGNSISIALGNAVNHAVQNDQVLVAAAGNDGSHRKESADHNRPFWPAAHSAVIAVGAFDSTNNDLAPFTNRADVYAPGVGLFSMHAKEPQGWHNPPGGQNPPGVYQGWAKWSGTSFATPVVAAEIAYETAGSTGSRRLAAQKWLMKQHEIPNWPGKLGTAMKGRQMDPAPVLTQW
ncbi:MAG TPA: S8/S53 family peptidase [Actinophytocola sp.]|uniref:S8 family peptidase n=1 Tax=Actinophytocola sp. TaxID=1872138 RepID=UPI002DBFEEFF|nr:S8/S53 family peptidase [Actinophytocola sp.]HEU5476187.1 S8/S53 family peptidase [Actinophytocola sp.]